MMRNIAWTNTASNLNLMKESVRYVRILNKYNLKNLSWFYQRIVHKRTLSYGKSTLYYLEIYIDSIIIFSYVISDKEGERTI